MKLSGEQVKFSGEQVKFSSEQVKFSGEQVFLDGEQLICKARRCVYFSATVQLDDSAFFRSQSCITELCYFKFSKVCL